MIEAFVVLVEDPYETRFGDGYFAYFAAAFRTRVEADAWAARSDGQRYHVRAIGLERTGTGWSLHAALTEGERVDLAQVMAALDLE